MKYLLDTNTCIRFINGRSPAIRAKILTINDAEIAISSIVQAEMYAGSAKSQTPQHSREIQEEFFRRFVTIPFDTQTARIYGDIAAIRELHGVAVASMNKSAGVGLDKLRREWWCSFAVGTKEIINCPHPPSHNVKFIHGDEFGREPG